MPDAPRAFVAGATGYTGREVVRVLREAGIETYAHVRPDSPKLDHWKAEFEAQGAHVDVTPWTAEAIAARLRALEPSLVFALLGTTRSRARQLARKGADPADASYEAIDYGLTAMLLEAARSHCPAARFVYLSALGVKPNPRGGRGYAGVRARLEAELAGSGLSYAVARPAFVSGDDRQESRPLERWAARASDAMLQAAGSVGATGLRDRLHSLTGKQLAKALVSLALDPAAEGVAEGPAELRARL